LADALYKHGLINNEVRELIRSIAVNRNMLAHAYRSFSRDEMLSLRAWVFRNIPTLINQLRSLIDKSGIDPATPNESLSRVFTKHNVSRRTRLIMRRLLA
jgi:hypothetical protein